MYTYGPIYLVMYLSICLFVCTYIYIYHILHTYMHAWYIYIYIYQSTYTYKAIDLYVSPIHSSIHPTQHKRVKICLDGYTQTSMHSSTYPSLTHTYLGMLAGT